MNRHGMAIPVVMGVMVVVAGLVAAGLVMTVIDHRVGLDMVSAVKVFGLAEREAVLATSTWSDRQLRALTTGASLSSGGVDAERRVTRRAVGTFFFEGRAASGRGGIERRVGLIGMAQPAVVVAGRAVASDGAVHAALGAVILDSPGTRALGCDASDSAETGWLAMGPDSSAAELVQTWRHLATAMIADGTTLTPRPQGSSGWCDVADPLNWGDPTGPRRICARHWPVVHGVGSMSVVGGVGQGILVVEGDLELSGGFMFEGLIVVGGRLVMSGFGASVKGAISIEDRSGAGSQIGKTARVAYSTCSLDQARRWLGPIDPIRYGGWFGEY